MIKKVFVNELNKLEGKVKEFIEKKEKRKMIKLQNKVIRKLVKKYGYSYNGNINDEELFMKFIQM